MGWNDEYSWLDAMADSLNRRKEAMIPPEEIPADVAEITLLRDFWREEELKEDAFITPFYREARKAAEMDKAFISLVLRMTIGEVASYIPFPDCPDCDEEQMCHLCWKEHEEFHICIAEAGKRLRDRAADTRRALHSSQVASAEDRSFLARIRREQLDAVLDEKVPDSR